MRRTSYSLRVQARTRNANQITSADGGWRVLSAFAAQWPAAAEFLRQPTQVP